MLTNEYKGLYSEVYGIAAWIAVTYSKRGKYHPGYASDLQHVDKLMFYCLTGIFFFFFVACIQLLHLIWASRVRWFEIFSTSLALGFLRTLEEFCQWLGKRVWSSIVPHVFSQSCGHWFCKKKSLQVEDGVYYTWHNLILEYRKPPNISPPNISPPIY